MNQREAFRETLRLAVASAMPEGDVTDPTSLAHMREMYEQIQGHEFSDAKLGRWLGWAQCALVAANVGVSLDDVKAINMQYADVRVAPIEWRVEQHEHESGFEVWLEGQRELARHDMDASLFNEIAGLLMSHPDMKALFAMERLRHQYGRSTRKRLGLDERSITRD